MEKENIAICYSKLSNLPLVNKMINALLFATFTIFISRFET